MIVDDEPGYATLVTSIGLALGYEVIATDDPAVFRDEILRWKPTVVVLDLVMPQADGIELMRYLSEYHCPASILIVSASDDKVLETCRQLGIAHGLVMAGVLRKPFRTATLRALLERLRVTPALLTVDQLAEAIRKDELVLHYQPRCDLGSGGITGCEALVRWKMADSPLIGPDRFIGLAEESGLIEPLTEWVVSHALEQTALWRRQGLELGIAVNLSALSLGALDFPDRLAWQCARYGVPPTMVTLEITETAMGPSVTHMMDVLTRFRIRQFSISLDDFGTGYSSLVQLQRMPFNELKIDKSFVIGIEDHADNDIIVRTIVGMAQNLSLRTVAEGVESAEAMERLGRYGCHSAQGFFISRPLPAGELPSFLIRRQAMLCPPEARAAE